MSGTEPRPFPELTGKESKSKLCTTLSLYSLFWGSSFWQCLMPKAYNGLSLCVERSVLARVSLRPASPWVCTVVTGLTFLWSVHLMFVVGVPWDCPVKKKKVQFQVEKCLRLPVFFPLIVQSDEFRDPMIDSSLPNGTIYPKISHKMTVIQVTLLDKQGYSPLSVARTRAWHLPAWGK